MYQHCIRVEQSRIHQQHRIVHIIVIYVFCTLLKYPDNKRVAEYLNRPSLLHVTNFKTLGSTKGVKALHEAPYKVLQKYWNKVMDQNHGQMMIELMH